MKYLKNDINFIKYSKHAYILSLFIITIGIICYFTLGIKTSIDFSGGSMITAEIKTDNFDIDNLRKHLQSNFDMDIKIDQEGKNNTNKVVMKMKFLEDEQKLRFALNTLYNDNYQISKIESIGPVVGDELKENARNAILFAVILIGVYIAFRFDSYYAIGSIIALIHDVAITLTGLMLFQYEISISIIAALLTIVGYSLNDTIVIYDRIRENLKVNTNVDRNMIVNKSLNITLNRTIITSLTTLMVACVLFLMGGAILRPFSLALIIGVVTGTYSSMFIASPIMLILEDRYKLEELEED